MLHVEAPALSVHPRSAEEVVILFTVNADGAKQEGTTSTMMPDPTALQTALGWTSVLGGIMNPNLG